MILLHMHFRRHLFNIKLKHMCFIFGSALLLDLFGVFTHIFELSYNENYMYPYQGNIVPSIHALQNRKVPGILPINDFNYSFIFNLEDYCIRYPTLRIIFIVKSSADHFERRQAIRNSWGFRNRFVDVPTKTIFILGIHEDDNNLQSKISKESNLYKDILQIDFLDTYYNNTIKTIMSIKWAVTHCSNSEFYMFVDDDMYISVKNVLNFVRNPAYYPDYLKDPGRSSMRKMKKFVGYNITAFSRTKYGDSELSNTIQISQRNISRRNSVLKTFRTRRGFFDIELPAEIKLFSGYVFISSPHRHKTSKWYVSLKEYPYDLWPPYVTAGAFILSKNALVDMYFTSLYTEHFRFDDIFLGIVAKKADIELFHCDEFYFLKRDYTKSSYKYVITSHGFSNPDELVRVWNEQKVSGNAERDVTLPRMYHESTMKLPRQKLYE